MSSTISDFWGDGAGEKVCACGETENLTGINYDVQAGDYSLYICPKCKAEMEAKYAERVRLEREAVARMEANDEMHDQ